MRVPWVVDSWNDFGFVLNRGSRLSESLAAHAGLGLDATSGFRVVVTGMFEMVFT